MKKWVIRVTPGLLILTLCTCATLQQIAALRHVAFSLDGVDNGRLAGVSLDRISSHEDLSILDVGRLALAVAQKDLPLEFLVNVLAENPPANGTTATLARLAWSLLLDDVETISGTLDQSYSLPPGEPVSIPLQMSLNLVEFFDGSAESLVNLAAALVGSDGDPTRVALRVVPTVETPLGPISYPSPITVVSRSIGGLEVE